MTLFTDLSFRCALKSASLGQAIRHVVFLGPNEKMVGIETLRTVAFVTGKDFLIAKV